MDWPETRRGIRGRAVSLLGRVELNLHRASSEKTETSCLENLRLTYDIKTQKVMEELVGPVEVGGLDCDMVKCERHAPSSPNEDDLQGTGTLGNPDPRPALPVGPLPEQPDRYRLRHDAGGHQPVTLRRLWRDVSGGTIVEYAIVLAFFALLAMGGFQLIASSANNAYCSGTSKMTDIEENPLPTVAP